jgi:hypothetical protein
VIQKGLWRDNLNPEISTWEHVVTQAEIIEISEGVAERRDRKAGGTLPAGLTEGSFKARQHSTGRAIRSVAFESQPRRSGFGGSRSRSNVPQNNRDRSHQPSNNTRETPRQSTRSSSYQNSPARTFPRGNTPSAGPSRSSSTSQHRQLSDKDKAEYRAAGKCFVCGEVGHMSRSCPKNHSMHSSGSRPPGKTAFSVEPVFLEEDEPVEILDSLPLGAMSFDGIEKILPFLMGSLAEWQDHFPYWNDPGIQSRKEMGESYSMVAESILTDQQPFPGDEHFRQDDIRPELRFRVLKRRSDYVIYDYLTDTRTPVAESLLRKPQFDISRWYARLRSRAAGLGKHVSHSRSMGPAVGIVAAKLLTDGISSHYPSVHNHTSPNTRFRVYAAKGYHHEPQHMIVDRDLNLQCHISTSCLENRSFDLVDWYSRYLDERMTFRRRYLEGHLRKGHSCRQCHPHAAELIHDLEDLEMDFEHFTDVETEWGGENIPAFVYSVDSSSEGDQSDDDCMPGLIPISESRPGDESDDDSDEADSLPDLEALSDSEGGEDDEPDVDDTIRRAPLEVFQQRVIEVLSRFPAFPGDTVPVDPRFQPNSDARLVVSCRDHEILEIFDRVQGFEAHIHVSLLRWPAFSIGKWYAEQCARNSNLPTPGTRVEEWMNNHDWEDTIMGYLPYSAVAAPDMKETVPLGDLDLGGVQVDRTRFPALQRSAAHVKGNHRVLPRPIVVKVLVNGYPARALLDSGSLGDFMSSTLADQLNVKRETLTVPLALQLAVQGSRSKVNSLATVNLQYQGVDEERTLDIININNYDLILGTPWMYQHQVCLGFNPARVVIGSDNATPLKAGVDTKLMAYSLDPESQRIDQAKEEIRRLADPLCKEVDETELPPLRDINHTIPLIDETKTYPWRPSRCPEAFRPQWAEKRDAYAAYLKSGRWKITSAGNTVPMLLIPKPGTVPPQLRTVIDLRERNKNTHKLTSPLPDIEGMLRRAANHRYRTTLDLKSAYEQIRIVPEHVPRSAVTTPDGNMVSLVIQIGDCNAPATYQALMNHIFSPYIGRFMDIYLDDIVVYSDTLEEHVEHVKLILRILEREKLYLSRSKLHVLEPELKLLGRIIDDQGIRMDLEKVDSVLNWKVPTNRDLLRGFIGSVGYLADDIPNVRIPMGILSSITGDTVPFRWSYTEQRAFDEVKELVQHARDHRRVPLNYSEGAPPIWMVTDGCSTGVAGVISQGMDWKTAKIAAFYSAKLNPAQQNYPVHEIEMLAGIETMLRHTDVLQGVRFKWLTDHKGLTHLLNQKNLSGRQARWLEKISAFDFEVVYIEGSENVVADALSRMYASDSPGTVRSRTEYTSHDVMDDDTTLVETGQVEMPLLAGIEARVASQRRGSRVRRPTEKAASAVAEAGSSRTFAARMRDNFVLHGPVERKEGGLADNTNETTVLHTVPDDPPNNPTVPHVIPDESALGDAAVVDNRHEEGHAENNLDLSPLARGNLGIDIVAEVRGRYTEDTFFRTILEKPKEFRNFEVKEQLLYLKEDDSRVLCIPKIDIQGRSAREIVISEAHSMLAHLGASKTLDYLRVYVWWKEMASDVKSFCETCHTCKTSKPSNQKPYGLLNPLSVPCQPWESIGIDFVGPLPESGNRDGAYDSITVVICLLTSMVHLVPSRTNYNATQIAELMFDNVYKFHGLPRHIISDRDVLFTSTFWSHLHKLLGTKLRMSSAYHPQSDGATERANRTVTQMLRQCIHPNQKDWVSKLPAIEFAINSARSESTGYAPFFLNFGRMPRSMLWDLAPSSEYPTVREFALQKKLALLAAHDSMLAARVKQTRDANRKRQSVPFKEGDLAYLSSKNISFPKGLARKLIPKYIGPYKILKDFGNASYQLDLPPHLKRRGVHNVFHSSLLRVHIPSDDRLFPGRMDTQISGPEDSDGEWAVDRILSHAGAKSDAVFEIKWKSGDVTWLPYYQITHLQALTDYFELLGVARISNLPVGAGSPPSDDPQVFIGAMSYSLEPPPRLSWPVFNSFSTYITYFKEIFTSVHLVFFSSSSFISPTLDLEAIIDMSFHPSEIHPNFTRISPTQFVMKHPDYRISSVIHVSHIATILQFDEEIRLRGHIRGLDSVPFGFVDFAEAWNRGVRGRDPRRISTITFGDQDDADNLFEPSRHPVSFQDFRILPDQTGPDEDPYSNYPGMPGGFSDEYDYTMSRKHHNQRNFEERHRRTRPAPSYPPNHYSNRPKPYRDDHSHSHYYRPRSLSMSRPPPTPSSSYFNQNKTSGTDLRDPTHSTHAQPSRPNRPKNKRPRVARPARETNPSPGTGTATDEVPADAPANKHPWQRLPSTLLYRWRPPPISVFQSLRSLKRSSDQPKIVCEKKLTTVHLFWRASVTNRLSLFVYFLFWCSLT